MQFEKTVSLFLKKHNFLICLSYSLMCVILLQQKWDVIIANKQQNISILLTHPIKIIRYIGPMFSGVDWQANYAFTVSVPFVFSLYAVQLQSV